MAACCRAQRRSAARAGLQRITLSLDTLDAETFRNFPEAAARSPNCMRQSRRPTQAGFSRLKLNCVVMRGVNDDQVLDMVEHFRGSGHILRFIEYMDVGTCNDWREDRVVPSAELRERIAARWPMHALAGQLRRRSGAALGVRRRRRRDRLHQLGQRAVLRRLHARPAVGRRTALHLPVRQQRAMTCSDRCGPAPATPSWPAWSRRSGTARDDRYSEMRGMARSPIRDGASRCTRSVAERHAAGN